MFISRLSVILLFAVSAHGDNRLAFGPESPAWLQAVGVIHAEYVWQDNPNEWQQCSGALIAPEGASYANLVATAGHCIQGWIRRKRDSQGREVQPVQYDYASVQSPMTITFNLLSGESLQYQVQEVLIDRAGHTDLADYALLSLSEPVPVERIQPLIMQKLPFAGHSTYRFGLLDYHFQAAGDALAVRHAYRQHAGLSADEYLHKVGLPRPVASLAGYSADPGLGEGGRRLTYDPLCDFIDGYRALETTVWCRAYPGASGGPFVISLDRGAGEQHFFVGVLSGGTGVIRGQLRMSPHDTPAFYDAFTQAVSEQESSMR